ncbi:MAG: NADH-quinone oxidoreductase subunit L [Anaerolineaceae bacterium]|nr:NADH-quinone oxidoreductase subunit L [Anaerolineaceae bacterium]
MTAMLIALSIALPWLGAFFVWLPGDNRPKVQHTLAVVFSVATGVIASLLLLNPSSEIALSIPIGGPFGDFTFVADGLGIFLAIIATVIGSLAVIFSVDYMKGEKQLGRYYALVLFFIGSMVGLVLSSNLLLVFIFWEITALCSYALISFNNDDPKAVAGGMKALIITQLGGIGLLVGALLIYNYTGSYDLNNFLSVANTLPANILGIAAFGFLFAAAAKSSQFPFHTWLPDAMEAPTPISALIHAATMVNAGVYLLIRFFPAFEHVPGWRTAVVIVGMVSALLAGIMAVVAMDLKRVLAYSTVSQLGYMIYSIGAGGIFASQFHLLSHAIFKALLFLSAGAVIHIVGTRDMQKMGGLGKKMPFVRTVFIIGSLALAGIPILNGFWSKELILEGGLLHGPIWAYVIMVFVAGLTALYTYRCVDMVFFGETRSELHTHDATSFMKVSLSLLAAGTLLSWLLAGPFTSMLHSTLPAHEIHAESTMKILAEVFSFPTLIALLVVALGLIAWWQHEALQGVAKALSGVASMAKNRFGFESINKGLVNITMRSAETLRNTQTGIINWNIFYIVAGLVILLAVLALGA